MDSLQPHRLMDKPFMLVLWWTLLVSLSLSWGIWHEHQITRKSVVDTARANFFKDQAFRLWGTLHGGVYVPASEHTPPNPYLAHLPERDIQTPSGNKLTLMNPAYMVRQMVNEFPGYYGVRGRITSLKPLNPGNLPDAWEQSALQKFEEGVDEVMEFTPVNGEPALRLMRAMVTKPACLKCHASQGYQQGDIRGGVGVIVPMGEFLATERRTVLVLLASYFIIWLAGCGGIVIFSRRLRQSFLSLQEAKEMLEQKVRERTTELRNSNEKLGRSESQLAEAQHLARLGCWDLEHGVRHFSDELLRLFGLPVDQSEVGFEDLWQRIIPQDRPEVEKSFQLALDHQGPWAKIFRIVLDGEQVRYLQGMMNVLPREGRIIGTIQDITERRMAELSLSRSEQKFRTMVEFTNDWEYWISPTQQLIYISPSCKKISGFGPEEFMADPNLILQVIHPKDRAFYQQHIQEIYTPDRDVTKVCNIGFRIITRSGEVRRIEHICRSVVGEDGIYLGRRVSNRDITDRVRIQERMTRLMEVLPSLFIEVDQNDQVSLWNHAAEEILGLPAAQVLHSQFLELPLQWEWSVIYEALDRTITQGKTVTIPRLRHVRADGRIVHLELTFHGFDEYAVRKIMVLGHDITEKLAMETRTFHASKLEAVGTLAAGIAHEINTPVQFIGGGIYFLKESFTHILALLDKPAIREMVHGEDVENLAFYREEIPASLEQIQEGVRRITAIVGAMKAFSYPSGDDPVPTDLNLAITNTLVIARNEIKYVADVEVDLDRDLPLVHCLANEINQVLLNLVVNAAHAIKDNLSNLPKERGMLRISSRHNELEVLIEFSDNGSGIPKEIQDRIFEPFFTTKPVGKGTGQGLAICHAVVCQHHGGSITFESQVGIGTRFLIKLPLHRNPQEERGIG